MDIAALYLEGRVRLLALAADIDDEAVATKVPTCPQWTVHDVYAHQGGAAADILAGRLEGVATDAWTGTSWCASSSAAAAAPRCSPTGRATAVRSSTTSSPSSTPRPTSSSERTSLRQIRTACVRIERKNATCGGSRCDRARGRPVR